MGSKFPTPPPCAPSRRISGPQPSPPPPPRNLERLCPGQDAEYCQLAGVTMLVVLAALMAVLSGCSFFVPHGANRETRLQAAETDYGLAVLAMTVALNEGWVDADARDEFEAARKIARSMLDKWGDAVDDGHTFDGQDALNAAMEAMWQLVPEESGDGPGNAGG